jgi:hypothetical protein
LFFLGVALGVENDNLPKAIETRIQKIQAQTSKKIEALDAGAVTGLQIEDAKVRSAVHSEQSDSLKLGLAARNVIEKDRAFLRDGKWLQSSNPMHTKMDEARAVGKLLMKAKKASELEKTHAASEARYINDALHSHPEQDMLGESSSESRQATTQGMMAAAIQAAKWEQGKQIYHELQKLQKAPQGANEEHQLVEKLQSEEEAIVNEATKTNNEIDTAGNQLNEWYHDAEKRTSCAGAPARQVYETKLGETIDVAELGEGKNSAQANAIEDAAVQAIKKVQEEAAAAMAAAAQERKSRPTVATVAPTNTLAAMQPSLAANPQSKPKSNHKTSAPSNVADTGRFLSMMQGVDKEMKLVDQATNKFHAGLVNTVDKILQFELDHKQSPQKVQDQSDESKEVLLGEMGRYAVAHPTDGILKASEQPVVDSHTEVTHQME